MIMTTMVTTHICEKHFAGTNQRDDVNYGYSRSDWRMGGVEYRRQAGINQFILKLSVMRESDMKSVVYWKVFRHELELRMHKDADPNWLILMICIVYRNSVGRDKRV